MTGYRLLAALLARVRPSRGRHQLAGLPEDTVVIPRVTDDDQGDEHTRLDLDRARPYLRPGDEGGDYPRWLP
jgi:hypothetical protein